MIRRSLVRSGLNLLLVTAFFISGLVQLSASAATLDFYDSFGFPKDFSQVIGFLEIASALLLIMPTTRMGGSMAGGMVAASAAATACLQGSLSGSSIPATLFAVIAVNAWGILKYDETDGTRT
jgi:hypothetical protein